MAICLTENAISTICTCRIVDMKPVLQIFDLRRVNTQNPGTTERFRLVLSDGVLTQQGMLATQLNHLVNSGKMQRGSIVQLNEFTCGEVQGRLIIIIVSLTVMLEQGDIIGEPRQYSPNTNGQVPPQVRFSSPAPPSINQAAAAIENPQSFGGSSVSISATRSTISGGTHMRPPEVDHGMGSHSFSSTVRNSDMGRYTSVHAPSMYTKIESSAGVSAPPGNSSMRPIQQTYHQQSPRYNRGPVTKNEGPGRIIPIAALNPYQGSWTIKARVTAKGECRHYSNSKGEGKVFSFDLLDSSGGEIRVTCFNTVLDQFYDLIEVGKVFLISRGTLKPAQKSFNHLRNDYEIHLDSTSTIQLCIDDDGLIPQQQFHFRPISDIEGMEKDSVLDVIGIVCSISPSSSLMRKNGTETKKQTLQLKDMSGHIVEVTLWGNFCNADGQRLLNLCDSGVYPVLALKSGRVNDYNGKTLGTIGTSQLFIQPDFPEAQRLKGWFENEGKNTPSVSLSRDSVSMVWADVRKTVSQIKDERLGTSEKPDFINVSATVIYIKPESFCYTACPIKAGDRQCSKKVTNNGDGTWRCDKCDQTMSECDYRYILQFQIQDHTGSTWVTAFQEFGEEIMGMPAKDLYDIKYESHDDDKFAEILRNALFNKYIFKLKVKEETFSDEQRVKSTVMKAEKMSFSSETRFLLQLVDKLKSGDPNSLPKPEFPISTSRLSNVGSGFVGNREPAAPVGNYMGNTGTSSQQYGPPVNQYAGPRLAAGGYTGVSITCNSCGGTGHSSSNCPSVVSAQGHLYAGSFNRRMSSGSGGVSSAGECYKCHQVGHLARDCPDVGNVPRASSGGVGMSSSSECFKCHKIGHWARDCPNLGSIPQAYGSGNASVGRYGGAPKQYVGGV